VAAKQGLKQVSGDPGLGLGFGGDDEFDHVPDNHVLLAGDFDQVGQFKEDHLGSIPDNSLWAPGSPPGQSGIHGQQSSPA
jgi:hypothetical protein